MARVPSASGNHRPSRRWRAARIGAVGGPQYEALPRELRPERGLLGLRSELELFANLLLAFELNNFEVFEVKFSGEPGLFFLVHAFPKKGARIVFFNDQVLTWNRGQGKAYSTVKNKVFSAEQ